MHRLRDHLSYGLVDREPVFLDLAQDFYFQIDEALADALARLRAGTSDGARDLRQAGLIVDASRPSGLEPAAIQPITHDLLDRPARTPTIGQIAETGWDVACSSTLLRLRPLHRLVASNEQRNGSSTERILAAAIEFEAARRQIPIARRCLVDALALSFFLKRRKLSATLVFGVTLHPFAAHCWLQRGDCLLTGSIDAARGFTPVLVV